MRQAWQAWLRRAFDEDTELIRMWMYPHCLMAHPYFMKTMSFWILRLFLRWLWHAFFLNEPLFLLMEKVNTVLLRSVWRPVWLSVIANRWSFLSSCVFSMTVFFHDCVYPLTVDHLARRKIYHKQNKGFFSLPTIEISFSHFLFAMSLFFSFSFFFFAVPPRVVQWVKSVRS